MKIFKCELCGNITILAVNGGGPLSCCGKPMVKLEAGTVDAAKEKHVPSLQRDGTKLTVQVGEVLHPMTPEHYIQMIVLKQGDKVQYVTLTPQQKPTAEFNIEAEGPVTVYEYCNLHGLWSAKA